MINQIESDDMKMRQVVMLFKAYHYFIKITRQLPNEQLDKFCSQLNTSPCILCIKI